MKVIDLLNKIAKGEEVPKKIKYDGKIFEYTAKDYHAYAGEWLFKDYCVEIILNHEVEIEEDKDIEKLKVNMFSPKCFIEQIEEKINELVNEVNRLKRN